MEALSDFYYSEVLPNLGVFFVSIVLMFVGGIAKYRYEKRQENKK